MQPHWQQPTNMAMVFGCVDDVPKFLNVVANSQGWRRNVRQGNLRPLALDLRFDFKIYSGRNR